ncbi:MAG: hypothetical protein J6C32_05555 [Eubacterium sp.]|nr:hypothetical protein [Eubacterium sp.]
MLDIKESGKRKNMMEKCFVMMPISDQGDYPKGHFDKIYEHIFKPAIKKAGYEPYRVDENKLCDSIIGKIFSALQESPMALCDLSNRNPNVLYELGIRQAYDKPVVLVQDEKTERIFDVSSIKTVQYSSKRLYEEVLENRNAITEAIRSTSEGKRNSIIKVVNVKNAEVQKGEVSKEDKIEVLLSGLLEDVKELKKYNVSPKQQFQSERIGDWEDVMLNGDVSFIIMLKHGITNKDIDNVVNDIKKVASVQMDCLRKGDRLFVRVYTNDMQKSRYIRFLLQNGLSRNP